MNQELNNILKDREARWKRRVSLAAAYALPVGTLTLNIPGPDKNPPGSREVFNYLVRQWRDMLRAADLPVIHSESHSGADGPCAHAVVRGDAGELKRCSVLMEERGPLGRLADADILDSRGHPVGREDVGLPPRLCLQCGQRAALCIREGRHSMAEVLATVQKLLLSAPSD